MTRTRSLLFGALVALFACTGCTPGSDLEPLVPLTVAARWADVTVADRELEISQATSYRLGSGWSRAEPTPEGTSFAWGLGEESHFFWRVLTPRDLELELHGRPYEYEGSPVQTVRVDVNGIEVGAFDMVAGWSDYRVRVPASAWLDGDNVVGLRYAHAQAPRDLEEDSSDPRPLAAAWSRVRVAGAPNVPTEQAELPVAPRVDDDRIFLPWDSRLDVYLSLPEVAALDAAAWSFRGAGTLHVGVATDDPGGGVAESTTELTAPPKRPVPLRRHESADAGDGRVRLRLAAVPDAGTAAGGVLLHEPVILAPPARQPQPAGVPRAEPEAAPRPPVPDLVVLYLVDTLRADHLAAWSGSMGLDVEPVPTPRLDAFAADSVVFRRTLAQAPWTRASVASVLSGLWPPDHGAVDRDDSLSPDVPILPEILQRAGWRTEAVVTNVNITATFGFDRGFDHFDYLKADAAQANEVVARRLEAARERRSRGAADERLFLYVHVIDPHSPYDPPAPWREAEAPGVSADFAARSLDYVNNLRQNRVPFSPEKLRQIKDLYRAEVAYSDAEFGRFLDLTTEHGFDEAAVLYVSDHGDEFLEHGNLEHGRALYEESVWVPMALRWPGLAPRQVDDPVQHIDVLPTLLRLLRIETETALPQAAASLRGVDLLDGEPATQRPLFSHLRLDGPERSMVLLDGYKAMVEFVACDEPSGRRIELGWQLYDTAKDPGETVDLAERQPVRLGWMRSLLRQRLGPCGAAAGRRDSSVEIDEETRKGLEALGYL